MAFTISASAPSLARAGPAASLSSSRRGMRSAVALSRRPAAARGLRLIVRAAAETDVAMHPISLTDNALKHLKKLRAENNDDSLLLRVGVRQGGCSGMEYVMDFEAEEKVQGEDARMDYDDFGIVVDPKSLLYLFGLELDYSDALIGGGFQFQNPNAEASCGCGKSFTA